MTTASDLQGSTLDLKPHSTFSGRQDQAVADVALGLRLWRLCWTLGWLDIRLRYRGSVLGPLWLTLSTAIMVGALGVLYSTLFRTNLHEYLPFLALSIVLWNFLAALVGDGCTCFTSAESMIRSVRMPYFMYAARSVIRNVLVFAHNIVVIVAVYAIFDAWPGWRSLLVFPGVALWMLDSIAVTLLLGAFCARFRDIPPIVGSIMQIAFFVSPVIWKPELVAEQRHLLPLNPFFSLFEIVRAPLLGQVPDGITWVSAIVYSTALCAAAWVLFVRVRGRLAFWL
jgi:lipopolysaccharide transport system permease protein